MKPAKKCQQIPVVWNSSNISLGYGHVARHKSINSITHNSRASEHYYFIIQLYSLLSTNLGFVICIIQIRVKYIRKAYPIYGSVFLKLIFRCNGMLGQLITLLQCCYNLVEWLSVLVWVILWMANLMVCQVADDLL